MKKYLIGLALVSFFCSGCGPILGQFMGRGEGLKSMEVISGHPPQLKAETSILVFGPFNKTDAAF
jgi:hypothetical protein